MGRAIRRSRSSKKSSEWERKHPRLSPKIQKMYTYPSENFSGSVQGQGSSLNFNVSLMLGAFSEIKKNNMNLLLKDSKVVTADPVFHKKNVHWQTVSASRACMQAATFKSLPIQLGDELFQFRGILVKKTKKKDLIQMRKLNFQHKRLNYFFF